MCDYSLPTNLEITAHRLKQVLIEITSLLHCNTFDPPLPIKSTIATKAKGVSERTAKRTASRVMRDWYDSNELVSKETKGPHETKFAGPSVSVIKEEPPPR